MCMDPSLMVAFAKRTGPTRMWKTLRGKKVKTNDAKDLGEINKISDNYTQIKNNTQRKFLDPQICG
jgi:hypothetical protein